MTNDYIFMTIDQKALNKIELIILISMLVIYGYATYQRNLIWKDEVTFWSDVVKKSPQKEKPYNNLGRAYLHNRAFQHAVPYLEEALNINPYFTYAHYNLGIAYQGLGHYDEAIIEYKKVLLGTKQPYFAEVHNNLGVCYFMKGRIDMSIEEFKIALNINPDFSDARFNLDIAIKKIKKGG